MKTQTKTTRELAIEYYNAMPVIERVRLAKKHFPKNTEYPVSDYYKEQIYLAEHKSIYLGKDGCKNDGNLVDGMTKNCKLLGGKCDCDLYAATTLPETVEDAANKYGTTCNGNITFRNGIKIKAFEDGANWQKQQDEVIHKCLEKHAITQQNLVDGYEQGLKLILDNNSLLEVNKELKNTALKALSFLADLNGGEYFGDKGIAEKDMKQRAKSLQQELFNKTR